VGLLQVADGALSQVTSLLDRAITLATEASNGTLNSTQEGAANQEYQSILAEVNNIGSTTTYNQQAVFSGNTTAIYTGDSSTTGSSIDDLNIRTLSESSVGDTGGVMAYSNGNDNVFVNLSTSTTNAQATDTLNSGGTTTLDVNYLVKGATGSSTAASTTITVGTGTGFANTVDGMISAINSSGLGLNATFSTQAASGVEGGGAQTGIEITGGLVSAGVAPGSDSTSGILNPSGIPASELLTQGQAITINQGGTQTLSVTVGTSNNTLASLANAINTATGNTTTSGGVTTDSTKVIATVITNGDGTQSLSLANANSSLGALTVTSQSNSSPSPSLGTASLATNSPTIGTTSNSVGANATVAPKPASAVFSVAGTNGATTQLSAGGSITIENSMAGDNVTDTFIVGTGVSSGNTYYTGTSNDTMADLASTIQAATGLNVTATATSAGLTVTSNTSATGDNITITNTSTLTNASNTLGLYSPTDGGAASVGSPTTTELDAGAGATQNDQLSGVIHLTNGTNTLSFTAGVNGNTYSDLVSYISANSATLGVTAQWTTNMPGTGDSGILLTSTSNNASPVIYSTGASDTLGDATTGKPLSNTITSLYAGAGAGENDVITGSISLVGNSNTLNFTATAGETYADLATAINGANLGVNATWSSTSHALLLTSNTPGVQAAITASGTPTLADSTIATGGSATVASFNAGAGTASTDVIGGTATFTANGKSFTYTGNGTSTSFADLATALGQSDLGVTATFTGSALVVTSATNGSGAITMQGGGTLTDEGVGGTASTAAVAVDASGTNTAGSAGTSPSASVVTGGADGSQTGTTGTLLTVDAAGTGDSVLGTAGAPASYATAVLQLNPTGSNPTSIVDASDEITGQISLTNNGVTNIFVQGNGTSGGGVIYTTGTTVADLTAAINKDTALGLSAIAPGTGNGAIYLQATTAGADTISSAASTLADVNYASGTQGSAGATVSGVTSVTGNAASVSVGLTAAEVLAGDQVNSNDVLGASSITVGFGANSETFTINSTGTGSAANTTYLQTGVTLSQLASAISGYSALGVSALATTNGLTLTSTTNATSANEDITVSGGLTDTTLGNYSQVSLGSFGSENDTVTGSINYDVDGGPQSISLTGQTVATMIQDINDNSTYGVKAAWDSNNNTVTLTSTTEGTAGDITALGSTRVNDTADTASLSYTASSAYNTGVSSGSNTIYDSTDGQTNSATGAAAFATSARSGSGVATTSYSDGAGVALNGTDLLNQTDAQSALTELNTAVTDVAAQDGYIGAQINTLNSISQVMSTQQENVVSAQNAIQATDYASATSNMSKYEILSQTGIAALAQANSVQQEVTKLLQ
jgi:flagellin